MTAIMGSPSRVIGDAVAHAAAEMGLRTAPAWHIDAARGALVLEVEPSAEALDLCRRVHEYVPVWLDVEVRPSVPATAQPPAAPASYPSLPSAFDVQDGDSRGPLSVPGTGYELWPSGEWSYEVRHVSGQRLPDATDDMHREFSGQRVCAETMRAVAAWLVKRSGLPVQPAPTVFDTVSDCTRRLKVPELGIEWHRDPPRVVLVFSVRMSPSQIAEIEAAARSAEPQAEICWRAARAADQSLLAQKDATRDEWEFVAIGRSIATDEIIADLAAETSCWPEHIDWSKARRVLERVMDWLDQLTDAVRGATVGWKTSGDRRPRFPQINVWRFCPDCGRALNGRGYAKDPKRACDGCREDETTSKPEV